MTQLTPTLNNLLRFTKVGLTGLLLTPLIITNRPYFLTSQSYLLSPMGKAIAFRVGVEVLLILYVALVLLDRKFLPPKTPLLWAVLAYLTSLVLATAVSLDPYRSWWGTLERMDGTFAVLHYGIFFIMLAGLFRTRKEWLAFFNFSLAVSVVVGVYGVVERAFGGHAGVMSTLDGRPFLATYAMLHIFLAGLSFHLAQTRLGRAWAATTFAVNLLTLLMAGERGALVGLVFGLLVLAVAVLVRRMGSSSLRVAAIAVIALSVVTPFLLYFGRESAVIKSNLTLYRLAQSSVDDSALMSRVVNLKVSGRAFIARPLLGYGPELFLVAYNRNFDTKQLAYEHSWMDRSHNKLADVLVMQGLLGLLAYLGMFAAAGWPLYGAVKGRNPDAFAVFLTVALLLAYFVQNLFLFDMPASYLLFYATLAWVSFLGQEAPVVSSARSSSRSARSEPPLRFSVKQQALLGLLTIVVLFSIYKFNAKAFAQGWAGEEASASIGDPEKFSDRTQAALSGQSWLTNDIAGTLADVLTQNATAREPAYSQAAGQVASQLEKEIAVSNLDPRAYIRLGALYNVMGAGDRSALPKAEAVLHTAIQTTPNWPEYYDALAQTYLLEGRNDEALALLKKAVDINPENGVALWMYAFPLIWNHHEQEGRAVLEAATQRYNYENREDLKRLVNTYYQLKDFTRAIQFEKELVQLEPADAAHRYTLATLYKASGNTGAALEEVKIAAQLDPRYNAAIRQFQ